MMRGSIAAAALLLVSAIGVALVPISAEDLMMQAHELRAQGDTAGMNELLARIQDEFPDSPEAEQVLGIRAQLDGVSRKKTEQATRAKQAKARQSFEPRYERLVQLLESGDIQQAAGTLAQDLQYLKSDVTGLDPLDRQYLKREYLPALGLKVELYFERARKRIEGDIRYVSSAEQSLKESGLSQHRLEVIVKRLTAIKQSDWPLSASKIDEDIGAALDTDLIKEMSKEADRFRSFFRARADSFAHLEHVFYRAKSLELKEHIRVAQDNARKVGRDLLAQCEFEKARLIYKTVLDYASSASNPDVREHYAEVIAWIAQMNIEGVARRSLEDIDEVTSSLKEVEQLKKEGREDAAYRLMRDLIKEHRLIQFERRYKLPYKVISRPAGARVFVNDQEVGRSPCAIEMGIVERTNVRIEAPGFEMVERRLEIADPSLEGKLDVSLQKVKAWDKSLRGAPEARPVMAGSLVLVPTNEASLLALRATDGGEEWEAKTGMLDRITATPLTDVKRVHFVTIGGEYFAVSLSTGETEKRLKLGGEIQRDGVLVNGTVYFATRNRKLIAVRDGKILFEKPIAFDPVTALHHYGEEVIVGTADGYVLFHSLADGKETRRLQSSERSSFFDGVAAFGDLVVGAAEDGYLYGFDPREAEPAWRYRMSGSLAWSPVAAGDSIYLPSNEGFLWRIGANGKKRGQIDVRKAMNGPPVEHRGFLYTPAGSRVIAYDISTGASWWEVSYEDEQPIHVAAGDRLVVVVTDHGRVIAYAADKR
jgi:outer membrane protein assembly factor BamB